ncbi:MAG: TetR/AcrR family transcriptional regulator, partial [Rhodospirillaceae bacterium]
MKALKQRRAPAERPAEIVEAALALFVEKGFAGTRLDDVAARAGLSKAAIYLYFEDKMALFQGVIRQAVSSNLLTVEALTRAHQGPVADLIPRMLDFMASRVEETPMASIAKIVISESRAFPEIGRFYLKEVIGRGVALFEGLIAKGVAQGEFRPVDPVLTVRSLVGPMLLAIVWKT